VISLERLVYGEYNLPYEYYTDGPYGKILMGTWNDYGEYQLMFYWLTKNILHSLDCTRTRLIFFLSSLNI
jgi:hypothetical protein